MSMIPFTDGLLPALIGYYHRLSENQSVAEFGFAVEKISFCVVLEPDGTLFACEDIRERNKRGKPFPRSLIVPNGGTRTSGIKPFFCWDNTSYTMGADNKSNHARAADMFAAFRDLHLKFCSELAPARSPQGGRGLKRDELAGDEGFSALCRFLDRWEPARAEQLPNWEEVSGCNVVFKLRGHGYIHESQAVRSVWMQRFALQCEKGQVITGPSLINGQEEVLARLHSQISGVVGANTSGAGIVSFNLDAFESYGKSQNYNAPIGVLDAHRYTTALNHLLADSVRRVRIGDMTVVWWSESPEAEEALKQVVSGQFPDQLPDGIVYTLGLSPNVSRLHVRLWTVGTVEEIINYLIKHVSGMRLPDKEVPDWLKNLKSIKQKEDLVYLDKEHPSSVYHCGRILAVVEWAQFQALGKNNIVQRTMGAVMGSPARMLGRLQRTAETAHIPQLPRDVPIFVRDELKAINAMMGSKMPSRIAPQQEGEFTLGYYQQGYYLDVIGSQIKSNRRRRTNRGEWVISRIEVKVANTLHKYGLDYTYEPQALLDGTERWPDFVVRTANRNTYIEVLGMDTPEYNERWEIKQQAYGRAGITVDGGPHGQLIVIDHRGKDIRDYDERVVHDALRHLIGDQDDKSLPKGGVD